MSEIKARLFARQLKMQKRDLNDTAWGDQQRPVLGEKTNERGVLPPQLGGQAQEGQARGSQVVGRGFSHADSRRSMVTPEFYL